MSSPLVIGGTGGSGTRAVAKIVRLSGRYMGADRNGSEDALRLAGFDWEWGIRYLESGSSAEMDEAFEAVVGEHLADRQNGMDWGWKHPHSYLLLPFLRARFPTMRFIHVIRDGRDIAFSANQQQACQYGPLLNRPSEPEELRSAAWWAWANLRAQEHGERLGNDYLLVRLEDLCSDPTAVTRQITAFSDGGCDALGGEVVEPPSLGRWRRHDRAVVGKIEAVCGKALRSFGYLS